MPVPAAGNGVYCDTLKDALAPLKIAVCLGVKAFTQVVSSFSPESGPYFCSCWLRTT